MASVLYDMFKHCCCSTFSDAKMLAPAASAEPRRAAWAARHRPRAQAAVQRRRTGPPWWTLGALVNMLGGHIIPDMGSVFVPNLSDVV